MAAHQLTIGQVLLRHILEHCLEERPLEACGILTGVKGQVLHAYATENVQRSPFFYEVDPDQREQVLREMATRGEELVGIYHSHPTAGAAPSLNDVQMAVYFPEAVRLIISLTGPIEVRGFVIQGDRVLEVRLCTSDEPMGCWHDLRGGGQSAGELY